MMGRRPGLETQKGASLAEFALVAPLFAVLLFGLVEFGLAMYTKEVVNNASRRGQVRSDFQHSPEDLCGNYDAGTRIPEQDRIPPYSFRKR